MKSTLDISDDVLTILNDGKLTDDKYYLPNVQLDREMYTKVNKVLEGLGGKWNRKGKCHLFGDTNALREAMERGHYANPKALGFFATPDKLASTIVARLDIQPGATVLEPSAGTGSLAVAAFQAGGDVICVEIDQGRVDILKALGFRTVHTDFLFDATLLDTIGLFDHVVMNPPFAVPGDPRADISHVLHAIKFLKPGGSLVAIMGAGILFREDERTKYFLSQVIDKYHGSVEPLPDGSFAEYGTNVRTAVLTLYKD